MSARSTAIQLVPAREPSPARESLGTVPLVLRPAAEAVRDIARERLADAARGYEHLLAGEAKGLHDLRVALRRLRTLMRAFGPLVEGSIKKKTMRALRAVARATSEARDAEVAAAWVVAQADESPRVRAGIRDAAARMVDEQDAALKSVREYLARELPDLLTRLGKQLDEPARDAEPQAGVVVFQTFGEAAAAVAERQKTRLSRALARVKTVADADDAHRARIAAKRLRYVLEPLHAGDSTYELIERLVVLQDALGAARDAHQLTRRFVREIGELAARDARLRALVAAGVKRSIGKRTPFARVRPGLVELARRAHADERRAFASFRKEWGGGRAAEILETVR